MEATDRVTVAGDLPRLRPQLVDSPEETALFVNMNGERMSRQGFWKLIKYYQEKAESSSSMARSR